MKFSLCTAKYIILVLLFLISLYYIFGPIRNTEGFLNMEKKYKKVYMKINSKLENMINYLPNLNFKNNIRRLKRKYI